MNEVLIFANPIAGRGKGAAIARRLERHFPGSRVFLDPPEQISNADLKAPASAAIVIGGDGTLRGVAQRLLSCSNIPPILVVPLGTANLMARHLGIRWSPKKLESEVAEVIGKRNILELDAARANDRLFLLMVGVGFDANVVHELDKARKGPITVLSYLIPILSSLKSYDYPPLRVEVDGRVVADGVPALAFIGNVKEYGTGFPVLTRARPDDDMLDVCVLPCKAIGDFVKLATLTLTGAHVNQPGVVYEKGKSIRVESDRAVPVQIDGEASGHTPLSIELLDSRLPFIVP